MEYNTKQERIRMREYGRHIQSAIEAACQEPDKEQRMQMAREIIYTMNKLSAEKGNSQEKTAKLWNHLAYISGYQLDIDYPVEIIRED